jgi:hypothetical protein
MSLTQQDISCRHVDTNAMQVRAAVENELNQQDIACLDVDTKSMQVHAAVELVRHAGLEH